MGLNQQLVSVVVRTRNRSALLRDALKCLTKQTYRNLEIWVVDHNSTDDTHEVVQSFGARVRYILHTGPFFETFNIWRPLVTGQLISFLDDDDYIKPECIETLVALLNERIDVDVAFGRQRYFIDDGNRCRILSITERLQPGEIRKKLLKSNVILWNAVIIRREVLTEIPLIGEGITGSYDWHFWIYAALANLSFYQIPTILGYVRISPDSVQREMIRMSTGDIECVKHYGSKLTFREKMLYGYFNAYGGRLIRYGIICMESGLVGKGRKSVIKGLLYFFVSARGRLKWLTACLILFASLVSDEKKARNRCEKLLGFDIFRNYYEKFS